MIILFAKQVIIEPSKDNTRLSVELGHQLKSLKKQAIFSILFKKLPFIPLRNIFKKVFKLL